MDPIKITQDLIRIPSHVKMVDTDGTVIPKSLQVNEIECAKYICDFIEKYTDLKIQKQFVDDSRFNVLAGNISNPSLIIFAHMDTVGPSNDSKYGPFSGNIIGDRLYGVGSTDMKSGIASMLVAMSKFKGLKNVLFVFYIDEEYDLRGMKEFVEKYKFLRPKMMLSADFEGLMNGCRGLIEIQGTMIGKSAHASRPQVGVNAAYGVFEVCKSLEENLRSTEGALSNSLNLGYIEAGKGSVDRLTITKQVNAVPDTANFSLDIRPGSKKINAKYICRLMRKICNEKYLELTNLKIVHDYGSWHTPKSKLSAFIQILGQNKASTKLLNPETSGFIDIQLAWKSFGRPPTTCFGPGTPGQSHTKDEYVIISDIIMATQIYADLISLFR